MRDDYTMSLLIGEGFIDEQEAEGANNKTQKKATRGVGSENGSVSE